MAAPLETELRIEVSEAGARLMHGENIVAEGRTAELDLALSAMLRLRSAARGRGRLADLPGTGRERLDRRRSLDPGSLARRRLGEGAAGVLGELCARVDGALTPEEACVVVGWLLQTEGRKRMKR